MGLAITGGLEVEEVMVVVTELAAVVVVMVVRARFRRSTISLNGSELLIKQSLPVVGPVFCYGRTLRHKGRESTVCLITAMNDEQK